MPRRGEPAPNLGALRRALGLTTEEAANRLGITVEVLVNYEHQAWGYDPAHDAEAMDAYLAWAIAAYASDDLHHEVYPILTKEEAPAVRHTQRGQKPKPNERKQP